MTDVTMHRGDSSEFDSELLTIDEFVLHLQGASSARVDAGPTSAVVSTDQAVTADLDDAPSAIDEFIRHLERRPLSRVRPYQRVCQGRDRVAIAALMVCWSACVVSFWIWWLQPVHQVSVGRSIVVAGLLLYMTVLLPALPVLYLIRIRRVNPALPVPRLRVAFLVTKAPSEPWDLVRKTLMAMKEQSYPYPYDVWLCDEAPSEVTIAWCVEHDVHLSTRDGVAEYHRKTWPRRTKCKEGNLAYFYDHWGYERYDVVAQLDADHVPTFDYLEAMVQPFRFERVGYVAAPNICDANAAESWAARGRLHKDALLHGASQAGCNEGFAPICHGSHYAVRTSALRGIGGIGPELAEDFTTTFLLTSAGWEGAFALDAEAHGEGPPTFASLLVQEFQWSQSLTLVSLRMYFKYFRRLPWRLRARFGLVLLYYPMLAITTMAGLLLAPIAVVTGKPWMNVNYFEFIGRWILLSIPLLLATTLLRRRKALRPVDAKILSWEGWLFSFARWPSVAKGVCSGLKDCLVPRPRTIKVTPKGDRELEGLSVRLLAPYFVVCAIALGAVWARSAKPSIRYYVILCLLSAGVYLLVAGAVALLHAIEIRRSTEAGWSDALGTIRGGLLVVFAMDVAWVFTVVTVVPKLF